LQITKVCEKKVFAIIVLFNPDYIRLENLIASVQTQVKKIVLVDNTAEYDIKKNKINDLITPFNNIKYLSLQENLGIASAQNIGISYSLKLSATHILLLDQDSFVPNKMVEHLLYCENLLNNEGGKVAAIGPSFRDEKTGTITGAIRVYPMWQKIVSGGTQPIETDYLISSGTLINEQCLEDIGLMREDLFIDLVDIEWCARARKAGFKCYITPNVIMEHNIGNEAKKYFGKNVIKHSDFRHYFIVRNTIYLILRGRLTFIHSLYLLLRLPLFLILHIFTSSSKKEKFKLLSRAIKDGILGKMGKGCLNT